MGRLRCLHFYNNPCLWTENEEKMNEFKTKSIIFASYIFLSVFPVPQYHENTDGIGYHGKAVKGHGHIVHVDEVIDDPHDLSDYNNDFQPDLAFYIEEPSEKHGGEEGQPMNKAAHKGRK